jgi:hypothetical protein
VGLPAIKVERSRAHLPHIRLVKPAPRRASRRAGARAEVERARRNFKFFGVIVVCVAALGVGRVWLSVEAAETSLEADRLRADIKIERYQGDMLEVRQSALGSPSRIRAIAGKAMDMAPADTVTYMDLRPTSRDAGARAEAPAKRSSATGTGLEAALARVMDLTAGEAQVLLVGDVGLASTR